MKKRFSVVFILLAFIMTIGVLSGYSKAKAFALENNVIENVNIDGEQIQCSSKSAYLIDLKSGTVIYAKNDNRRKQKWNGFLLRF